MSNGGGPIVEGKRDHIIKVRLNDEELGKLKFICKYDAEESISHFVRTAINKKHHDIWEAIKYECVVK